MADGERPLETGWLTDTPAGDNVVRAFTMSQAALGAEIANAFGGRSSDDGEVALADSNTGVAYFNQAVLLRPVLSLDDPMLERIESFYAVSQGRPRTLLSMWPTPDLTSRGWQLLGHPAFVVRPPAPHGHSPAPGVAVEVVERADRLVVAERVAIEGYPMDELRDEPPGALLTPALLATDVRCRLGLLDDEPVAVGLSYVAQGVVNLCLGATLPAARRKGVWEALVWARVDTAPEVPAVAYTSDFSRPGFQRMGFVPVTRFTLWLAAG